MVFLIIERLESFGMGVVGVKLPTQLGTHYGSTLRSASSRGAPVHARVHLGRVFSDGGKIVREIGEVVEVPVYVSFNLIVDLAQVHLRYGIPLRYFLEVFLVSFIIGVEPSRHELAVFPHEFKYSISLWAPLELKSMVEPYLDELRRVGEAYEVVGLLSGAGLSNLAGDLAEGLRRFYWGDYEGAIKFFRRVVESLRNLVEQAEIFSKSRKELLHAYLSKAFQLISNFGEHAGTRGSLYEAELSRDIALSASRYIVCYLSAKAGS